jgi:hypothetical protein
MVLHVEQKKPTFYVVSGAGEMHPGENTQLVLILATFRMWPPSETIVGRWTFWSHHPPLLLVAGGLALNFGIPLLLPQLQCYTNINTHHAT